MPHVRIHEVVGTVRMRRRRVAARRPVLERIVARVLEAMRAERRDDESRRRDTRIGDAAARTDDGDAADAAQEGDHPRLLGRLGAGRRTSRSSTTRPSTRSTRAPDRRDRDPGPRLAAAAVRPRAEREADARPVLRHDRGRHGRGRDERHDRDRPDLPARQDRADAACAADPRVRLEPARLRAPTSATRRAASRARRRRPIGGDRGRRRRRRDRRVAAAAGSVGGVGLAAVGAGSRQPAAQRVPLRRRERPAEVHAVPPGRRAAARDADASRCASTRRSTTSSTSCTSARPTGRTSTCCSRARRWRRSSHRYYEHARDWRAIADAERRSTIPRRLTPAASSNVPPLR